MSRTGHHPPKFAHCVERAHLQLEGVVASPYASALARLYEQTGTRRHLARALVRGFLEQLTRLLRVRRNALPAEILAAWRQHDARTAERLQGLLRGVAELRAIRDAVDAATDRRHVEA